MAKIEAYKFATRPIQPLTTAGGFDEKTGKFKPFTASSVSEMAYEALVLDAITAAAEAGALDTETWVKTVFADEEAFDEFLSELENSYDEVFRITDRWWRALAEITGTIDEEMFVSGSQIAQRLREHAEETGQI